MKRSLLSAAAICVSMFALSLLLPSAVFGQTSTHTNKSVTKVETFLVIKITDENKKDHKVDYRVISAKQYKDEEKRIKKDYDEKLKEWQDLKKVDDKAVKPVRPIVKKIGTSYQTQAGAQKVVDKLKEDEENKENGNQPDEKKPERE